MGTSSVYAGTHLLLFSGFLGSGKTSLIIPLAKAAAASGRKVVVIVNEIGDIGIDNQLMDHLGLNVWELVAGCICCTLSGDLIQTLEKLDSGYNPDLVIVEASGAADPHPILGALRFYHGRPLLSTKTASVLDPLRLPMLLEVMSPLVTAQLEHADIIMISKTDIASLEEVDLARRTAHEINGRAQIVTSGLEGHPDACAITTLLPWPI
jgi:G3E family GTPase